MENPKAVWKSILRNHPFFQNDHGGEYGYDFNTMNVSYPQATRILKRAIFECGCLTLPVGSRPTATLEQMGDHLIGYISDQTRDVDGTVYYKFVLTEWPELCFRLFGHYHKGEEWWCASNAPELHVIGLADELAN